MIRINKAIHLSLSAIFLLVSILSCTRQMERKEAEVHLKAFDNELIRLSDKLTSTLSYRILKEISAIENVPLPLIKHEQERPGAPDRFNFKDYVGIYKYDSINNIFYKHSHSDSIIIKYTYIDNKNSNVELVLSDYDEKKTSSSYVIPTTLYFKMTIDGKSIMGIEHIAEVEHGMPTFMDFRAFFDDYKITTKMTTKLRKTKGYLDQDITIGHKTDNIFEANVNAVLGFQDSVSYYVKSITKQVEMYPISINAIVNNEDINLKTNNYVEEFNKNSNITIFSTTNNKKVGEVKLKTKPGSDKLDYVVYFKDGSFVFIDEMLFSAERILNFKL